MAITKYALLLLEGLSECEAYNAVTAISLSKIQRSIGDSAKSDRMTKRYLDGLEQQGFVDRGLMEGRAYTWFVTNKGKILLETL